MKRIWIVIALLCSLLVLASCGGGGGGSGDDDSDDNLSDLASMDITDAKSIFIRSGSGSASSIGMSSPAKASGSSSTSRLYKINDAGVVDEVGFFDKDHKQITLQRYGVDLVPVFIENINDDYIAVGFADSYNATSNYIWLSTAIIARKSDGAIFKLNNIPDCQNLNNYGGWGYIRNGRLFKSDNSGNIYYINQLRDDWDERTERTIHTRAGITKISVSGSGLTSSIITPSTDDSFYGFELDNAGNMVYDGWSQLTNDSAKRLRTADGIYKNVPTYSTIWTDQDGKFHFIDGMDVKVINPSTFETEVYGSFPDYPTSWADYKVSLQGYTYLISNGGILEVYNSTASPRTIDLGLSITNIFGVASTEYYYYIAGKDTSSNCFLIKVTPGGASYTNVLGNKYQVYAFSASETDGITFNALDTSTMKKVLGKVSINGGAPVILDSENDNSQITFLERIR